ncbi:nucleotidyltransferase [Clostridium sp. Cult1]|uniref:nucleotidyltransferase n=1 Tax=Clostridium sp. Cult1 TaxID=2079002 RepID=UPI001F45A9E6|nr:nucleotidyltransferase [Clostridium sp. Cult1]MCF6462683.1 nucleotidyltransferase [Clostridium sp. Cult1]
MKVVGLITEYNPFHLGHKYHLNMSKKLTNSDYSIAVMSGSFVQRGEPSLIDKWTKAKMAIDNGVDLVIELPFIFSTQSAELFAYGSIALLHNLSIVDCVAFGSELGSLDYLNEIAEILVYEPPHYKENLRKYLNEGNSFSVSRSNALQDYFEKFNVNKKYNISIKDLLKMSNNILAIEYLKALKILNSKIQPVAIKRIGSSYNENQLNHKIASATGIRKKIINGNIEATRKHITNQTYDHLINYINKYKKFNMLDNYTQIIHYLLRIGHINNLIQIMDVESGLENRITKKSTKYSDINDLIQAISTKRYPKTRIQRILIHLMANLTKPIFRELYPHYPCYIRVLGSNEKGFVLLNKIKEESKLPIIMKFSDHVKYKDLYLQKIIEFDKKATDLFFLGLNTPNPFMDMDYYTTPYIKKK